MRVSDSGFGLVRVMATGVLARAKHPASCGRAVCFLRSTTYNQTLPAAWRRLLPGSGAAAPLQLGRRSCCGWGKRGLAGANFPAEERQKPRLVSEPEMFLSAPSSSSTAPLISLQGDLGGARAGPRSQRITGEEEEGRGKVYSAAHRITWWGRRSKNRDPSGIRELEQISQRIRHKVFKVNLKEDCLFVLKIYC